MKKNHYPLECTIHLSCNRPQLHTCNGSYFIPQGNSFSRTSLAASIHKYTILANHAPILFQIQICWPYIISVNHRDLINNDLAMENGNDLRVYYKKVDEDCQPSEIDRIVKDVSTTKTTVLFKLQEDLNKTVLDGSAYYLVYGKVIKHEPYDKENMDC